MIKKILISLVLILLFCSIVTSISGVIPISKRACDEAVAEINSIIQGMDLTLNSKDLSILRNRLEEFKYYTPEDLRRAYSNIVEVSIYNKDFNSARTFWEEIILKHGEDSVLGRQAREGIDYLNAIEKAPIGGDITKTTRYQLTSNLIAPKRIDEDFDLITSTAREGTFYHGTSFKNFKEIIQSKFVKPSEEGLHGSGVYISPEPGYALVWSGEDIGSFIADKDVLLRFKNIESVSSRGVGDAYNKIAKLPHKKGIPLEYVEVWDPVQKKWIAATEYE